MDEFSSKARPPLFKLIFHEIGLAEIRQLVEKSGRGALEGLEELCDLNRVFLDLSLLAAMRKAAILTVKGFPTQRSELANQSKTCMHIPGTIFLAPVIDRFDRIYVPRSSLYRGRATAAFA